MRFVETRNSTYRLGWPARATFEADSDPVWPPALLMASSLTWYAAVDHASAWTQVHTISEGTAAALMAALHDDGNWQERRDVCRAIAKELLQSGRRAVAAAWSILDTDIRQEEDRCVGAAFVSAAFEEAGRTHNRPFKPDEDLAADGWRLVASMGNADVENLLREGVLIDDPIAAARTAALLATRVVGPKTRGRSGIAVADADELPEKREKFEDRSLQEIIVLRELGGVDTTGLRREVKRAVAPILGTRLPLRPMPDLATARRRLLAEFPHAERQVDVIFSDLLGAPYAVLRPTMLVGPPGCGKSRLARLIASVLDLEIYRYEASRASDNTWGGTARRWSSGEPSVPVLAMIATKTANAMVLVDELDKAGSGAHNGRLWDAMLPALERETSARLADPFVGAPVDCSHLSYLATANDPLLMPAPLRDRFRILSIPAPAAQHLPVLCRAIVAELARESGMNEGWFPPLDGDELWMAGKLWQGGSVRRLREIVSRIILRRADAPVH